MYLITGANGQLGQELKIQLGNQATCADIADVDITNREATLKFIKAISPRFIINCAAYTAVDKAESEEEKAFAVNATGPENLSLAAAECGASLLHVSTDYVFDGTAHRPYSPNDATNPQNAYGRTKLAGEQKAMAVSGATVAVVRTAWLYSEYGNNFVKTMMKLGGERPSLNVIADQIGTPTNAKDLAAALIAMAPHLEKGSREIYHFTNEGVASWYDFATAIMELSGISCQVNPIPSEQYPTPAKRPFYSVLDKAKIKNAFNLTIRHWREALKQTILQ